jgi:hypothetical protein
MRASHIALIAAVLAIPSVGYAQQDNGPVGGPVQPDGSSLGPSPEQPRPSLGSPSGSTPRRGPLAGSSGSIAPGQVVWRQLVVGGVSRNVPVTPGAVGMGSAVINGQRVLVDLKTNRVVQQDNGTVGGPVGQGSSSLRQQGNGPVGGKVGADLGTSPQSAPATRGPYGAPAPLGHPAGYAGAVTPGQVVPENVPVIPQQGGTGSAFVNGHRVLVDPSNRILRVFN